MMKTEGNFGVRKWGIGICLFLAAICLVWGGLNWWLHRTWRGALGDYGSYLQGAVASPWALAGVFLVCTAFLAQGQQIELQQQELEMMRNETKEKIKGILRAIRYELEVLGEFYKATSGGLLANVKDGERHMSYFSLTEKYFIVYPNNTEIVGQLDDKEVCKAIVRTYNISNFLLEMYRINNWYLDRLTDFQQMERTHNNSGYIDANIETINRNLVSHAVRLKQADAGLKKETEDLLAKIDAYLLAHPDS